MGGNKRNDMNEYYHTKESATAHLAAQGLAFDDFEQWMMNNNHTGVTYDENHNATYSTGWLRLYSDQLNTKPRTMNVYESYNKLYIKPTPPAKIEEEAKKTITNLHREGKISMNQLLTIQQAINQSQAHWISVEDRLPETEIEVLVFSGDGYNEQTVGRIDKTGMWIFETATSAGEGLPKDQHWAMPCPDCFEIRAVTFWQPLPSPPTTK